MRKLLVILSFCCVSYVYSKTPKFYLAERSDMTMFGVLFSEQDKAITKCKYTKIDDHVTIVLKLSNKANIPCTTQSLARNKVIRKYQIKKEGSFYVLRVYFKNNAKYLCTRCSASSVNVCVLHKCDKRKILLDPGHGGRDLGTSNNGVREKDITLDLAKQMKIALEKTGKYDVSMTRYEDQTIPISKRVNIIKRIAPDVLISIHADNFHNSDIHGLAVYRYPNVKVKNKDSIEQVSDFLFKKDASCSSTNLGNKFLKYIPQICKINKNVQRISKILILGKNIPSILIETGYLSNSRDNVLLTSDVFKEKLAQSLVYSLDEFFMKD